MKIEMSGGAPAQARPMTSRYVIILINIFNNIFLPVGQNYRYLVPVKGGPGGWGVV